MEYSISHLQACCVPACSGRGVQHFLQGNERAENATYSHSNLWAGQERTGLTLFNLYLARIKSF